VIFLPQWIQKLSPALLKPEFTENPDSICRVIVEMASPQSERVSTYVAANEGKVHRQLRVIPSMVVELPYSAIQYMVLSQHVKRIWPDTKVSTMLDVAVPTAGGTKAHDLGFTGKDVTVAVIDTGVAPHPDLTYPESRIVAWNDLVNGRSTPYDDNGHGTHVAGIIAGNGYSSRGKYAGMAPEAKLVAVKALDRKGSGNTSDIISAIEWCIENKETYGIKAINLSIGAAAEHPYNDDPLSRAVNVAWSNGIVVCVAAGNDGPDGRTINTPGINPNVITVGNLDDKGTVELSDDGIAESSSRGPTIDNLVKPDILAPGTNIMSLRVGGGYRSLTGTSMATPMVTGAAAQMFQKWPSLKPDQLKSMLKKNARNLGLQSTFEGSGAINMENVWNETTNNNSNSLSSILNNLLGSLFGKKQVPASASASADNTGEASGQQPATNSLSKGFNLLPLSVLAIIPLMGL
jgi:serine protease AprX